MFKTDESSYYSWKSYHSWRSGNTTPTIKGNAGGGRGGIGNQRQHSSLSSHPACFYFLPKCNFRLDWLFFVRGMSIYSPAAGSKSRAVKYCSARWPSASRPTDGSARSAHPPLTMFLCGLCTAPPAPPFPAQVLFSYLLQQSSPVTRLAGGKKFSLVPHDGTSATAPAPYLDSVYRFCS